MNSSFRSFLSDVKERLFPDEPATVLEPESPPRWQRLGWKTGWIVEEAHTGLQWWVTDEHEWDDRSAAFGQTRRQKNQAFSRWYGSVLEDYRGELGVPLKLETVRWRQMDLGAFDGRPLIEEEDWWSVEFEATGGSWHLIFSERFVHVFEESESSSEPDPPWTFLELWERLAARRRRELLGAAGTDAGVLNHLAGLVLAGGLDAETLFNLLARQPAEDLREIIENRRETLGDLSEGHERQTLDRWRQDAVTFLTHRVGKWLLAGTLSGERWEPLRGEWVRYRENVLEGSFDDDTWVGLWKNFDKRDIERLVPRLNRETLSLSLVGIGSDVREFFREALPERQLQLLFEDPPASSERRDVLEAREAIHTQLREVLETLDYDLVGEFRPGE